MKLSYQISRHLANKFCIGHNLGVSAAMTNEMVQIKICCSYFRAEIEKDLINTFGRDFVEKNIKFNCGGTLTKAGSEDHSINEFQVVTASKYQEGDLDDQ